MLEIFDNIKIENIKRIDTEDKEFCEIFDKIYNETLQCYKNTLDNLILLYNKQIVIVKNCYDTVVSYYGDDISINNTRQSILKLKKDFISKICYYFSDKYSVTIDYNKIYEKYEDIELNYREEKNEDKTLKTNLITYVHIDYNIILDEIFEQLGGFNFTEKAIDELKQKAKLPLQYYSWGEYWNYEVKGKTIKFRVNIRDITPALYYYDNNEMEIIDHYTHNKIDNYKSYNNGNTDIKFYNSQDAFDFATKYLGYVEMTPEEREILKNKR